MRFNKNNLATIHQRLQWSWFFHFLLAATLTLSPMAAQAAGGRKLASTDVPKGKKFAADFNGFPLNADGTVNVIIQFNQTPQAQHFADLASRGGRMRFSLERINGAAYQIPVKALAWPENHPDVAYVTPDRPTKVASDDDIPAVMGDVARQQYGLDGTGSGHCRDR